MAESFSFDVVSDFDRQELVNTLDQVKREISQRYDLKGTDTVVDLDKENIYITTNSELTLNSVNDIIRQKAIKRNLSLKIFEYGEIEMVSGNKVKQTILLKQGINQEIITRCDQLICFAFHDSETLLNSCRCAEEMGKVVSLLFFD